MDQKKSFRIRPCFPMQRTIASECLKLSSRTYISPPPLRTNTQAYNVRYVKATITLPQEYLGRVIELCEANRGEQQSLEFFHATQVILVYNLPSAQLVEDFFGKLKGSTYVYCNGPSYRRIKSVLTRQQKGVRNSRLRGCRLAREQTGQNTAPRQQAARRRNLPGRAWLAGRPHWQTLGQ